MNTSKRVSGDVKKAKGFTFDYAPAPQGHDFVKIDKQYDLFLNGKFEKPKSKKYFSSINPSTGEELTQIALGSTEDVNAAVESSEVAFKKWSKLSGAERGKYLFRIARLIQEKSRELAIVETMDGGKPIKESRDVDLPLVAAHFFYYAGWADKLEYATKSKEAKPLGVVGAIIPWNFPLLMASWKLAPALAAGNTVVLKPAETTSLSALFLAKIFQEADLPPGVINIVTGMGDTGAAIVNHPKTKKIAFTGSTCVGKNIVNATAGTGKKLTLELGGKSANIIYEDAAIDQAVEGIVSGIYFNQGHVCCAGSRLLVEESVQDVVIRKLKKRMMNLRVGDPLDKNTDIGAINSKEQLEKIQELVKMAKDEGLDYFEPDDIPMPSKGYFHKPCLFNNVTSSNTISKVEVFGPVLSVQSFRTPEEAIQKANDSMYGLAAGIWSEKGSKVLRTLQGLKAGIIWTNTYNKFDPCSPFGGYKESGWGRELSLIHISEPTRPY